MLQILDLSGNPASLLGHPAFSSLPHLKELYLRSAQQLAGNYNKLVCMHAFKNTCIDCIHTHTCECVCIYVIHVLCIFRFFCLNISLISFWYVLTSVLLWQTSSITWNPIRYIELTATANPEFEPKLTSLNSRGSLFAF